MGAGRAASWKAGSAAHSTQHYRLGRLYTAVCGLEPTEGVATADLSELELPSNIELAFPSGKDHLQAFTIMLKPGA